MGETKISIVIPYYKESRERFAPLLQSINNQLGVKHDEIEVVVSCDNPTQTKDKFWDEMSSEISEFRCKLLFVECEENGGPGMARQRGIDAAEGEYLIFCDADDALHNPTVLRFYLDQIETYNGGFVMLSTDWIEEIVSPEGNTVFIQHNADFTWMHGKLIRKQFLLDNNITHHPDLRIHEDSYILSVIGGSVNDSTDILYVPYNTYIWKFYDDTITRQNNGLYTYTGLEQFITAIGYSVNRLVRLNKPELIAEKIVQLTAYIYATTNAPHWDEHEEEKQEGYKVLKKLHEEYSEFKKSISEGKVLEILKQEQQKHENYFQRVTFTDWLAQLEREAV